MTGRELADLRTRLFLTQVQFGQLFGIHPMTVSKWELDKLQPTPWQRALLEVAHRAVAIDPDVGHAAHLQMVLGDIPGAFFALLRPVFDHPPASPA